MFRNLFLATLLFLSSCILVVDDRDSHYSYDSNAVEGFDAVCYRDYGDVYDWYFELWGSPDLAFVDVYINYWKWVPLEPDLYGYWSGRLLNTYFYCDRDYDFEVVAEDYYGNVTYHVFYW